MLQPALYRFVLSFILIVTSIAAKDWEFVGPADSLEIQAMYCYSDSSIIAIPKDLPVSLMFISKNNGRTWDTLTKIIGFGYQRAYKIVNYKGILIASFDSEYGILKSSDTGKTWDTTSFKKTAGTYSVACTKNYVLVASGGHFYRSADTCKTWDGYSLDSAGISVLLDIETYGDTIFATGYRRFYMSTDLGKTWKERGMGYGDYISIKRKNKNLLLGSQEGVNLSRDLGLTWSFLWGGFEYGGKGYFAGDSIILLAMMQDNGTFISYDWGKTINEFSISEFKRTTINIETNNYYMFACNRKGIFRFPISEDPTDLKTIQSMLKSELKVKFINDILYIKNSQSSFCQIDIFSLNGRNIVSLKNVHFNKGTNRIEINKLVKPIGIFLIRIKTDIETMTAKFTLQ